MTKDDAGERGTNTITYGRGSHLLFLPNGGLVLDIMVTVNDPGLTVARCSFVSRPTVSDDTVRRLTQSSIPKLPVAGYGEPGKYCETSDEGTNANEETGEGGWVVRAGRMQFRQSTEL